MQPLPLQASLWETEVLSVSEEGGREGLGGGRGQALTEETVEIFFFLFFI